VTVPADGGRHPIIVLWTTPRSRSTAFERMMIERGDHVVFDEPFSARYYFSPERRSDRYDTELPDSGAAAVVGRLEHAAEGAPVFVKDMAYHAAGLLDAELLGRFTNCFLVREPEAALASFADKWPDLTEEEAGYVRLGEAFDVASALVDEPPPVLDADELCADPRSMVAAWCAAVGIPQRPESLSWEPGMVPQWELWRDWYEGVADSTGFHPSGPGAEVELADPRLSALAEHSRRVYQRLHAVRLRPSSPPSPAAGEG